MTATPIEVGQRWRRKRDGVVYTIIPPAPTLYEHQPLLSARQDVWATTRLASERDGLRRLTVHTLLQDYRLVEEKA